MCSLISGTVVSGAFLSETLTSGPSAASPVPGCVEPAPDDSCRAGCGACCIAPSISSAIPDMPDGKPAGERCIQLDEANLCRLFGDPRRPLVCERFQFDNALCGSNRREALERISALEVAT